MIKPYFILPFFYSDINYVVRKAVLNVNFVHIPCFSCKYTCIAFIWHYIYITFYFGNGILLAVQLHIRVKSIKLIVARLFGGITFSSHVGVNPWNLIVVISHYVDKYHPFLSMQTILLLRYLLRVCVGFQLMQEDFVSVYINIILRYFRSFITAYTLLAKY